MLKKKGKNQNGITSTNISKVTWLRGIFPVVSQLQIWQEVAASPDRNQNTWKYVWMHINSSLLTRGRTFWNAHPSSVLHWNYLLFPRLPNQCHVPVLTETPPHPEIINRLLKCKSKSPFCITCRANKIQLNLQLSITENHKCSLLLYSAGLMVQVCNNILHVSQLPVVQPYKPIKRLFLFSKQSHH